MNYSEKTTSQIIKTGLLTLVLLGSITILSAQNRGVYKGETPPQPAGADMSLTLPQVTEFPKFVKRGIVVLRTDFGDDYTLGREDGSTPFHLEIGFDLLLTDDDLVHAESSHTITVDNENPEGLFFRDLRDHLAEATGTGLDINRVAITNVTVTDLLTGGSATEATGSLRTQLAFEIAYGLNVQHTGADIGLNAPSVNPAGAKVIDFSWDPDRSYPNYQFQVLRLYNVSPNTTADETNINAEVDWNNAVTIETESNTTSLSLTLGEGQGYYVWRVRPVGTYYPGGIAHDGNWGQWNTSFLTENTLSAFNPVMADFNNDVYFYTDPDDDKNYIYSRVFTEGNKISETVTYANSLQQVRQTQTHLPSKEKTVTSQTVLDNVGRPAMTTLPVPQAGKFSGYRQGFVATPDGEIYQARHFDENANFRNPTTVSSTGAFGYYSENNPDETIPSAEGYPYSRVLFYNDGTGRVKEQSGVGKTHMIGNQAEGRGRTVRTLYSGCSEDELVALFGDEAPQAEAVQKVITIDQNNTATLTYTSKEGNVIATALTFLDEDNAGAGNTFEPLSEEQEKISVTDRVHKNIKTDSGFVSSKRVVFLEPTPITLEYQIECKKIENLCIDIEAECGYQVQLVIHNVDDPEEDIILQADLGSKKECEEVQDACDPDVTTEAKVILSDAWQVVQGNIESGSFTLPPGTYIFEKHLSVSSDIAVSVEDNQERIDNQIRPLSDWIAGTLEGIRCEAELLIFYSDLIHLSNAVSDRSLTQVFPLDCETCSGGTISFPAAETEEDTDNFWDIWSDPQYQEQYVLEVFDIEGQIITQTDLQGGFPTSVLLITPCCEIALDVRFTPPFQCPETFDPVDVNENGIIEVNRDFIRTPEATEYFPDLEGYGIAVIKECLGQVNDLLPETEQASVEEVEEAAVEVFYAHTAGWMDGEFNQMAFHMLTDRYACEGIDPEEPADCTLPPPVDPDPEEPEEPGDPEEPVDPCNPPDPPEKVGVQYQCADLADCWTAIILVARDAYCPDPLLDLDAMRAAANVSEGVDDNEEGDEEVHDDHFDDSFKGKGFLIRWIAKRKISKRMRDLQLGGGSPSSLPEEDEPFYTFHFANEFLQCAGYRFADIIAPDDPQFNPDYPVNSPETQRCDAEWEAGDAQGTGVTADGRIPLDYDFDGNPDNGEYDPVPFDARDWSNTLIEFDFDAGTGNLVFDQQGKTVEELFPNIRNPVYAFKYFEYQEGDMPQLELMTCFRDPNICLNEADRSRVPCCGGTLEEPAPCTFCGTGEVSCAFTKEHWSCGQRLTFFNILKQFREPPADFTETDDDITCAWINTEREWYDPLPDFDWGLSYISAEKFAEEAGQLPDPESSISVPGFNTTVVPDNPRLFDENTLQETATFAEIAAKEMEQQCHVRCEDRRSEFRAAVVDMFVRRCYIIGECKLSSTDNIVPVEDIELITSQLVNQCRSQCPVTTYGCTDRNCRLSNTPIFDHFMNMPTLDGTNDIETNFELGVGGGPVEIEPGTCLAGMSEMHNCTTEPEFSYYELTLWTQAREWLFDLDIESKCNATGTFVDADGDGIPDPVNGDANTYFFDEGGNLVIHQLDAETECPPGGNTFVPREEYVINPNLPPDPDNPVPGDPVTSPKVGIEVDVE